MSTKRVRSLAEGRGDRAAGPAVGRLDGEPRRSRASPPWSPPEAPRRLAARRHSVPTEAIEAPASVSVRRRARSSADGNTQQIVATSSTNGIPSAALAAYQRAETVINSADKSCNLTWQLVAAIGRVESNHGRFGGNALDDDGVAQPGIYGVALNGTNSTSVISDTDAGQFDNDPVYDRAVGPMQFIPSTWSVVGVDADGDGKRNPQDIDDAALATAVYLCSGDDDLSTVSRPARRGLPLQPLQRLRRPGAVDHGRLPRRRLHLDPQQHHRRRPASSPEPPTGHPHQRRQQRRRRTPRTPTRLSRRRPRSTPASDDGDGRRRRRPTAATRRRRMTTAATTADDGLPSSVPPLPPLPEHRASRRSTTC